MTKIRGRPQPSFTEIRDAITQDVIRVTSDYALVQRLLVPMVKQPKLLEHYPSLVVQLHSAVTRNVILALCRLFDDASDMVQATLKTFLRHLKDRPPSEDDRVRRYRKDIDAWLRQVVQIKERLDGFRNTALVHNDLTKIEGDKPIEFKEVEEFTALAQEILKRYYSAYEKVDQRFLVVNVEWEPKAFLEWCRLDDYTEHHRRAIEAKKEEFCQKHGGGVDGSESSAPNQ